MEVTCHLRKYLKKYRTLRFTFAEVVYPIYEHYKELKTSKGDEQNSVHQSYCTKMLGMLKSLAENNKELIPVHD